MEKSNKRIFAIIFVVILFAFIVSLIVLCVLKVNESWIGFRGGCLGAIFSGIITLWVMYYTMKKEENKIAKENNRRENNKYLIENWRITFRLLKI